MKKIKITQEMVASLILPRKKDVTKSDFGHAFLVAGSKGMFGAAILAAKSCLRSGVGKMTCHLPNRAEQILHISVPETLVELDTDADCNTNVNFDYPYSAIAIGPGIGKSVKVKKLLNFALKNIKVPLVLDADALNLLAENPSLLELLPENCVLTPHLGEFQRLFGSIDNKDKAAYLVEMAIKYKTAIVLKGNHTLIAFKDGSLFENTSGNPGLAKAGSGDVLTGVILSLLAQGMTIQNAVISGVYLHGLAADLAIQHWNENSLLASDTISFLSNAMNELKM